MVAMKKGKLVKILQEILKTLIQALQVLKMGLLKMNLCIFFKVIFVKFICRFQAPFLNFVALGPSFTLQ